MAGGGAPRRRQAGIPFGLHFSAERRGGPPHHSDAASDALVEAKEAWATELGTLDAVPRSITRGQLVMLRIAAPSQQTALLNHPS